MRTFMPSFLSSANYRYQCFNVVGVSLFSLDVTISILFLSCFFTVFLRATVNLFLLDDFRRVGVVASWTPELIPISVISLPQPTTDCTQSSWRPRMVGTEKISAQQ